MKKKSNLIAKAYKTACILKTYKNSKLKKIKTRKEKYIH